MKPHILYSAIAILSTVCTVQGVVIHRGTKTMQRAAEFIDSEDAKCKSLVEWWQHEHTTAIIKGNNKALEMYGVGTRDGLKWLHHYRINQDTNTLEVLMERDKNAAIEYIYKDVKP